MSDTDERERTFAQRCRGNESTTPVAVRVPDSILHDVDSLWEASEFDSRSAFIRALLRGAVTRPGDATALARADREEE